MIIERIKLGELNRVIINYWKVSERILVILRNRKSFKMMLSIKPTLKKLFNRERVAKSHVLVIIRFSYYA